jgi:thioredoxin-dependent peroxiredoxin
MIEVGSIAPEFDAPTSLGRNLKLTSLRGRPAILYFFPAADTPGCTIETKGFRDMQPELDRKGVQVVGISTDEIDPQTRFAEKCTIGFPLVADGSKEIARAYGVLGPSGRARRVSFFLDAAGRVTEVVDVSKADQHLASARARFLAGAGAA